MLNYKFFGQKSCKLFAGTTKKLYFCSRFKKTVTMKQLSNLLKSIIIIRLPGAAGSDEACM
jgi:hypothetical protein